MERVGLIAGSGKFPLLVAEEARKLRIELLPLGIKGVTNGALEELAGPVHYFRLGEISRPIKLLKAAGVKKAVMAGKVEHVSLFGGVRPDLRAAKILMRLPDKRTDTILRAVAEEFAREGIDFLSSAAWLKHLLAPPGMLTRARPSAQDSKDARLGLKAAKALSGFDIGQTVVVTQGAVVAVEAVEGTDEAVRRAAVLAARRGRKPRLVVVKVAKPAQDFRFDLPVVGLDSLKVFAECGVAALAIEAGSTLIFDRDEFIREAERLNISVVGLDPASP